MVISFKNLFLSLAFIINSLCIFCNIPDYDIIVDGNGNADFKTISSAINSLPMYNYQRFVIYIKNGIYNEKFKIEQDYITLIGENPDSTIIQYNQLRENWEKNKDPIGPAVINIFADDIILKNLSIINTQHEIGPHAFCIYGTGTRTILLNCIVKTKGGDAVSLWNYKHGMYYHTNCHFEGAVDFVCPRGWCYINNSTFYEVRKTAAIWHAGITDKNQKLVIKNSHFDGVDGFKLGRHHYEAQFYLINCTFSKSMADIPIYRVTYPDKPEHNRPYFFGNRYYFYNCSKEDGNYTWYKNNLNASDSLLTPEKITPSWTFDNRWDPEKLTPPELINYTIDSNNVIMEFSEILTVKGNLAFTTHSGSKLEYKMGKGSRRIMLISDNIISNEDIEKGLLITSGELIATLASVNKRTIKKL